jgi:hypothetical protein
MVANGIPASIRREPASLLRSWKCRSVILERLQVSRHAVLVECRRRPISSPPDAFVLGEARGALDADAACTAASTAAQISRNEAGRYNEKTRQQYVNGFRETWSGCRDSNPGPPDPQSGALPGCATSRSYRRTLAPWHLAPTFATLARRCGVAGARRGYLTTSSSSRPPSRPSRQASLPSRA